MRRSTLAVTHAFARSLSHRRNLLVASQLAGDRFLIARSESRLKESVVSGTGPMARRLIPLLDRVLVQKVEAPSKSVGGILLPDTANKVNEAQVVAVGPGRRTNSGDMVPVAVKEGDTVLLPEYGGQSVKLEDKEYFLYRDDEVLGVLTG